MGVAVITARQRRGDRGRVRAGRGYGKGWKRVVDKCQSKAEGRDEWCVRSGGQDKAGQVSAWHGKARQGRAEQSRAEQSRTGQGKGWKGIRLGRTG